MDLIATPRVSLPIARDHIERAARRSGVPGYQIDATVQSLSAHLGWDITQGSGAALLSSEGAAGTNDAAAGAP